MTEEEITIVVEKVLEKLGINSGYIAPAEYYSLEEAADLVSMSLPHMRQAVLSGTLVASDLGELSSPLYRISRESLLRWLKQHEVTPIPVSRHHLPKSQRPRKPDSNGKKSG